MKMSAKNKMHEMGESKKERMMEYGSPNAGMKKMAKKGVAKKTAKKAVAKKRSMVRKRGM
jgi:hypothetical protein